MTSLGLVNTGTKPVICNQRCLSMHEFEEKLAKKAYMVYTNLLFLNQDRELLELL